MKRVCVIVNILILTLSCNHSTPKTVLYGSIHDFHNMPVVLSLDEFKQHTTSDSNGCYKIVVSSNTPGYYKLELDNEYPVYLEPGWNIGISVNKVGKLEFVGKGGAENNFFIENTQYRDSILNTINSEQLFSSEKIEFSNKMKCYLDKLNEKLRRIEKDKNYSKNFVNFEYSRNLYWWADMMNTYPMMFKTYKLIDNEEIDSNYTAYLNDLNLNDPALLQLYEYQDFVKSYVNLSSYLALTHSEKFNQKEFKETYARFDAITKAFSNPQVLEYVLTYNVNRQINRLEMNEELMNVFDGTCKNDSIKQEVRASLNSLKKLFKGNKAPDFAIPDKSGKIYQLSDFKGKYLYLDVWSTSCIPCIAEFPYLAELEKDLKDKNIRIVSICLDNSENKWLKILNNKNLTGIQLRPKEGWKSDFQKDYMISSFPCYILIDKAGNFLNARAPRPSEDVKSVLLSLTGIN